MHHRLHSTLQQVRKCWPITTQQAARLSDSPHHRCLKHHECRNEGHMAQRHLTRMPVSRTAWSCYYVALLWTILRCANSCPARLRGLQTTRQRRGAHHHERRERRVYGNSATRPVCQYLARPGVAPVRLCYGRFCAVPTPAEKLYGKKVCRSDFWSLRFEMEVGNPSTVQPSVRSGRYMTAPLHTPPPHTSRARYNRCPHSRWRALPGLQPYHPPHSLRHLRCSEYGHTIEAEPHQTVSQLLVREKLHRYAFDLGHHGLNSQLSAHLAISKVG